MRIIAAIVLLIAFRSVAPGQSADEIVAQALKDAEGQGYVSAEGVAAGAAESLASLDARAVTTALYEAFRPVALYDVYRPPDPKRASKK